MADEGIEGLNRLLSRLGQMATDIRHVERPMRVAGEIAVRSIHKNFEEQGRPQRWTPLSPRTLASRRRGRGRGGVKILTDKGLMKAAVHADLVSEGGEAAVKVGLKKVQAARHHFGYSGGKGRGHSKTPARPFLMLQEPEDVVDIGNVFRRHIARQ